MGRTPRCIGPIVPPASCFKSSVRRKHHHPSHTRGNVTSQLLNDGFSKLIGIRGRHIWGAFQDTCPFWSLRHLCGKARLQSCPVSVMRETRHLPGSQRQRPPRAQSSSLSAHRAQGSSFLLCFIRFLHVSLVGFGSTLLRSLVVAE